MHMIWTLNWFQRSITINLLDVLFYFLQNCQKLINIAIYLADFLWMDGWMDRWMVCSIASIHAPFSTRRKYAYTIGARHFKLLGDFVFLSPRRQYLPMCFLLPCTVWYVHATVSHTRRMSCIIACHSWFCLTKEAEGTEVSAGSHWTWTCLAQPHKFWDF
jgi:hypothetical protein